nr:protein farnesyltransferase subunit beta [Quercus suber]
MSYSVSRNDNKQVSRRSFAALTSTRRRRGVRFRRILTMAAPAKDTTASTNTNGLDEDLDNQLRISELSSSEEDVDEEDPVQESPNVAFPGDSSTKPARAEALPPWLQNTTMTSFCDDGFRTTSSEARDQVTSQCLPLLTGRDTQGLPRNSHGLPHLLRAKHARFLHSSMSRLPAPYVLIDASRPWVFYWALAGLSSLGEDVSSYRTRLVDTVRPLQNSTGGFGGGHGQFSHCAGSYAATLALACVDGLDVVDRKAMWHWLGRVKQTDGGFCMAVGAEEDIRGAYCAMTIITLLNLPLALPPDSPARSSDLETFTDGLGNWISRCQTFEGGIAGAPSNEEHGAYAFCALACLALLDAPHRSIPRHLDVAALLRCLASLQTTPEGGFGGRHNKLVDACYSHWVGGCWALLDAALTSPPPEPGPADTATPAPPLWNRAALIRYLLTCAQHKKGGMRDKPSTHPDGYHTCYALAGLSAAQNVYTYHHPPSADPAAAAIAAAAAEEDAHKPAQAAFHWSARRPSAAERARWGFDDADAVDCVHPVFVIPMAAVERARRAFAGRGI